MSGCHDHGHQINTYTNLPLHTQDKYPTEFRLSKDLQQNYIYILCISGDFSEKNSIADLLKVIFLRGQNLA